MRSKNTRTCVTRKGVSSRTEKRIRNLLKLCLVFHLSKNTINYNLIACVCLLKRFNAVKKHFLFRNYCVNKRVIILACLQETDTFVEGVLLNIINWLWNHLWHHSSQFLFQTQASSKFCESPASINMYKTLNTKNSCIKT